MESFPVAIWLVTFGILLLSLAVARWGFWRDRRRIIRLLSGDPLPSVAAMADPSALNPWSKLHRAVFALRQRQNAEWALFQDALREVEKMDEIRLDRLTTLSADLGAPIKEITTLTEALAATPLTPSQKGDVAIIKKGCHNLGVMIDGILDLSNLLGQPVGFDDKPVNLGELLTDIRDELSGLAADGVTVKLTFPDFPIYVVGNRKRLYQVFSNLTGNAAKFTTAGAITIDATTSGERANQKVSIRVVDTGSGIPIADQPHLFNLFYQSAAIKPDRPTRGGGLGLATAHRLVEQHGGAIRLDSTVGVGSTFTVTLPCSEKL